jgi:exopolyphosphatase/guanosine-5'-triphosphate,3'-diphosphate pyrophosphatase
VRLAVVDIGSNTAHVVVVDGHADGAFRPVASERAVLRLADAAFPSLIVPERDADRLVETVARMQEFATSHGAEALVAFATSAIREATNGMDVLGRVRAETGIQVAVLPGAEEARLTYVAARAWAAQSAQRLLVIDIGGGSLEVAGGQSERPEFAESLPLGASRLTRRFVRSDPPRNEDLAQLRVHALTLLGPLAAVVRAGRWDLACATSKTLRTLANVAETLPDVPSPSRAFGFAGVDGRTAPILTDETVNIVAGSLAKTSLRERSRLEGLDRLRAGNVVAGSQLAALVMQAFGINRVVLAPWALREGLIIEHLQQAAGAADGATVGNGQRLASVLGFAHRHSWDEAHSRRVADLAVSIFNQTTALHGLDGEYRELLYFAGLLHDVGCTVSQSAHHKHSLYIIGNANLEGFSERELQLMANVARYHRKALPAEHHTEYMALPDADRALVRRLASLLRLADGLDLDHSQVVSSVKVTVSRREVSILVQSVDDPRMAISAGSRNADMLTAEFNRVVQVTASDPE